ncbi:acyltransferase [Mycobacterium sp. 852002-50816_SCH5313054-b]|uniref:acyltransferase family protein n=1 Tax=Mycobacterium sp. 852002-50816_SCH5313054-b TaxID=1834092 RepID=UPI0007FC81F9|nr:acyltransferase family protein [Mycobacterium sp. 852002-50816_SCH5313054-b]OBF46549.1 acyltransferase [Mycobacterium sp. 852002-50816_SCH5313054-b]
MTSQQSDSVSPTEEAQSRPPEQTRFRPDIEGLRAVAVLAVVLFHAGMPGISGGFVGVDVFFVISGFLITGLLWREANASGKVRLGGFYGARARRLLPASATVGVITAIAAFLLLPPLQIGSVLRDGIASALYVSNYWFINGSVNYFGGHLPPSPFQHYWSLGVEEQFYLVWPALIIGTAWVIRRVGRRTRIRATASKRPYLIVLALVAVASFALSLVDTLWLPSVAFYSLPTRAWQLAVGGMAALTADQWRRLAPRAAVPTGWAGLALILVACIWLGPGTPYPGIAALLPVLGAALVIGAGCAAASQGCGRVLGAPPMRAIGRISYSWYLWHWPVLVLAPAVLGHSLGLAARLAAALLSGVLAVLTLRFIENPLRFAPPIRRSAVASLTLGGAATAVAVCVGLVLLEHVPTPVGRGPAAATLTITAASVPAGSNIDAYDAAVRQVFAQVQTAVAASADLTSVPSNLSPPLATSGDLLFNGCLRNIAEVGQPECATGDTASTTTIALAGDSNAAMWNPALQQIAGQRRWRLETLAKGACPLMDLPSSVPLHHLAERYSHCQQWRDQIIARLRAEHPRLVVLSMWRGYTADGERLLGVDAYGPAWLDSLTRLVQQLRGTGTKVLVLGPIPDPQSEVPICLSGHLDDATACSPPASAAINQPGIAAESGATRAGGGQYADLTELFCTKARCPVIVGNTLVYRDWRHITLEYSRLLAPAIGALADRALAGG